MPNILPSARTRGVIRPLLWSAMLTLAAAAPLRAQTPDTSAALPSTTSTPTPVPAATAPTSPCGDGALPATADSVRVSLVATVTSRDTAVAELPADFTSKLVSALAPNFQAPTGPYTVLAALGGPTVLGTANIPAPTVLIPALGTRAFVTLRKNGSIAKLDMITQSMSLDIEDAIEAALKAADSAHTLPTLPDGIKRDSLPITITLRTVAAEGHPAGEVTQMTLPKYANVTLPSIQAPGLVPIEFPKADIPADAVELQFVIDAAGTPLPITFDTERVSYRESLNAVIDGLPKVKFSPASLSGCPVSYSVMQTFNFDPKNHDKR